MIRFAFVTLIYLRKKEITSNKRTTNSLRTNKNWHIPKSLNRVGNGVTERPSTG